MFTKIFKTQRKIDKHLSAPFVKERSTYLKWKMEKGLGTRWLTSIANILLLDIEVFQLCEETPRMVTYEEIYNEACRLFKKKQTKRYSTAENVHIIMKDFINTSISWLSSIGRFDGIQDLTDSIFNRLFTLKSTCYHYIKSPNYMERVKYLEDLERKGAVRTTLRKVAKIQLHAIQLININGPNNIQTTEIEEAAEKLRLTLSSNYSNLNTIKPRFINTTKEWLSFLGKLEGKAKCPHSKILEEYLRWLREMKGCSDSTIKYKGIQLGIFLRRTNIQKFDTYSIKVIDSYLESRSKELNRESMMLVCSIIRAFFKWAEEKKYCHAFSSLIKSARNYSDKALPAGLRNEEITKILNNVRNQPNFNYRAYAMLLLFAIYGLRSGEVANLKLPNIDFRENKLYFVHEKSNREDCVHLLPLVRDAIIDYIMNQRKNSVHNPILFLTTKAPYKKMCPSSIYQEISKYIKTIDRELPKYGPHIIRHAFASNLINAGVRIKDIADLMGHNSIESTSIYAKVDLTSLRLVSKINLYKYIK